jgi:hypothetical protein
MPYHRLLVHPSANRVYGHAAAALAAAEVRTVADLLLPGRVEDVEEVPVGRAAGVRFFVRESLTGDELRLFASCSGALVLFQEGPYRSLVPLDAEPLAHHPDDLLTTLKYAGKTNEQFTALMVNLALAASARGWWAALAGEPVRLLDPLCGRGTTLDQALYLGLDAVGVEERDKEVEAYVGFIRQWLRDKRIKHRSDAQTLGRGADRKRTARHTTVTLTGAGRTQTLDVIADDTLDIRQHVGGSSVDLVVADLPYGVQHGARTKQWGSSRNPATLLADALPGWRSVLRGGGAMCLAFNTNVVDRDEVDAALAKAGLDPVEALADGRFAHRVDRSIQRDVALAVKPS